MGSSLNQNRDVPAPVPCVPDPAVAVVWPTTGNDADEGVAAGCEALLEARALLPRPVALLALSDLELPRKWNCTPPALVLLDDEAVWLCRLLSPALVNTPQSGLDSREDPLTFVSMLSRTIP